MRRDCFVPRNDEEVKLFPVSGAASGESRQNDVGLAGSRALRIFAEARPVRNKGKKIAALVLHALQRKCHVRKEALPLT